MCKCSVIVQESVIMTSFFILWLFFILENNSTNLQQLVSNPGNLDFGCLY